MRSSTVCTAVLVGVSALASAQPRQEETSGRVSHKQKPPAQKTDDAPRRPGEWVELASPTPAKHGTEFVMVGKDAGYFSQLRLDGTKGRTIIRKVKVIFADGSTKYVATARTIDDHKSATIDLGNAKQIERVVVTSETRDDGQYAVYGASGAIGDVVKR